MFSKKFSSNIQRRKRMVLTSLILLVVFLGLGYSAFSTDLGINGILKVNKYNPKIYWALQDNDNDSVNETLVLSSEEVNGVEQGSFAADTSFSTTSQVPWVASTSASSTSNKSYNVTTVNIEKEIFPTSTAYWFGGVGYNASTFNANLEKLNISQATNMSYMFSNAGQRATIWNVGDLSEWDTSQVTTMKRMFSDAGAYATTWTIGDLSGWDTSQVTDMSDMFQYAGCNSTTWDIGDLSEWDTSKVTNMTGMFYYTGHYNATTWDILEKMLQRGMLEI